MKIIAVAKEVVVLKDIPVGTTSTGLIYGTSQNEKSKPEFGQVVDFGSGTKPFPFKKGDTVVWRRYTDSRVVTGSEEYNFIKYEDLMCAIEL